MRIVKIKPKSVFPELHSNTIFGALCSALTELYDEDVDKFKDDKPPFLISSAFPCIENEYFFPMPITKLVRIEEDRKVYGALKDLKKVRYVHGSIFEEIRKGTSFLDFVGKIGNEYKERSGFLVDKEVDVDYNIESIERVHNRLNRLTFKSEYYFKTGKIFRDASLFFLIKFNENYRKKVDSALSFLVDRGFGGSITRGMGSFEFEWGELKLNEFDGPYLITLSLYLPGKEFKQFGREVWYEPLRIQGRHASGIMKRGVVMLKEGSTFRNIGREFYGKIVDVGDDKIKITQYGIAFHLPFVGWKDEGKEDKN